MNLTGTTRSVAAQRPTVASKKISAQKPTTQSGSRTTKGGGKKKGGGAPAGESGGKLSKAESTGTNKKTTKRQNKVDPAYVPISDTGMGELHNF